MSLSGSRIVIATEKVGDVGEAINVDFCLDYDMSILFSKFTEGVFNLYDTP